MCICKTELAYTPIGGNTIVIVDKTNSNNKYLATVSSYDRKTGEMCMDSIRDIEGDFSNIEKILVNLDGAGGPQGEQGEQGDKGDTGATDQKAIKVIQDQKEIKEIKVIQDQKAIEEIQVQKAIKVIQVQKEIKVIQVQRR